MSTQTRQPKGIPVGGRFAASAHGEADLSLAEAQTAAQRAIEKAYDAGITEGARRARGEKHRSLADVMDLSGVTFDEATDVDDVDLTDPWGADAPALRSIPDRPVKGAVLCTACQGDGFRQVGADPRARCSVCETTGRMAPTPLGRDIVIVSGYGPFHRSRDGVSPDVPSAMRFEADRPLTDEETQRLAQLIGYKYSTLGRGEPMGDPERDSARSFIMGADTTKGRVYSHLDDFEDNLEEFLNEGSPVRKTNRAGAGTKGTRLVEGFGDPTLKIEVYYDSVIGAD